MLKFPAPGMKLSLHLVMLVGLLMMAASPAEACSCADPSQREKFRKADIVFLGEVLQHGYVDPVPQDGEFLELANFAVKRQWKGERKQQIRLLLTFDAPGMCNDLKLTVGRQYLMYAYREKEGWVSYTDCGPNLWASEATEEMKNLDSFWFRLWARVWRFN